MHPMLILACAGFGSFALVVGFVAIWAHAKDGKAN